MPLTCSSQRLIKRHTFESLCIICLPRSRMLVTVGPLIMRARIFVMAPTLGEIDIWFSFNTTSMFGFSDPPWFRASKAMPAVIAPSPMTETTRCFTSLCVAASAIPRPALIDVDEWPTPKVSYSLSLRFGKGARPPVFLIVPICLRRPVKILCG